MATYWPDSWMRPVPRVPVSGQPEGAGPVVPTGGGWSFPPAPGGYVPQPGGGYRPPPAPTGGGGGAQPARTPTQPAGGPDLGPFQSVDQWAQQFQAEHGRAPTDKDWADFQDSVHFYNQTGRGPTLREWKNRYYTGYWWPQAGGGGGGGGGGYGAGAQQPGYPADMGIYWWNTR